MTWRRSYDVPPPEIEADDEFSQAGDPRYADVRRRRTRTECLKDVVDRLLPYWEPQSSRICAGRTVISRPTATRCARW